MGKTNIALRVFKGEGAGGYVGDGGSSFSDHAGGFHRCSPIQPAVGVDVLHLGRQVPACRPFVRSLGGDKVVIWGNVGTGEENAMLKSIMLTGAALALAAACILSPLRVKEAVAQSALPYINSVDIDVASSQIDNYLAALKENGAASVHEPGCRAFNIAVSQKDPNHVFVFEVYDNAAAFDAHLQTDHFKKYAATTKDMVAKRDPHPLSLVAAYAKGK